MDSGNQRREVPSNLKSQGNHPQGNDHESLGDLRMADVGDKKETERVAKAKGKVLLSPQVIKLIREGKLAKGDVLKTAQISGIMAAKSTPDLIPLCHPVRITHVSVKVSLVEETSSIEIESVVKAMDRTGVEMEALTAVAASCLTIYDMAKTHQPDITIEKIYLVEKRGGRSGDYKRDTQDG